MVIWTRAVDKSKFDSQFYMDVNGLLLNSPYIWWVTCGTRDFAEEEKLYEIYLKGGPKATKPGNSAHNWGMAVDVALDNDPKAGLQATWNVKAAGWIWLKAAIWKHPRLHSLWKIGDFDHIERLNWRLHSSAYQQWKLSLQK